MKLIRLLFFCLLLTQVDNNVLAQVPRMDWVKTFGGVGGDVPYACEMDNQGNIITAGYFHNSVDFDLGSGVDIHSAPIGSRSMFVTKIDSSGNYMWTKTWSDGVGGSITSMALGADGTIYLTGIFMGGSLDFDPGTGIYLLQGNPVTTIPTVFLMKLNPQGDLVWANARSGNGSASITGLKLAGANRLYTCGRFNSSFDSNPDASLVNTINPLSGYDMFYEQYDTSGNQIWLRTINSANHIIAHSITVNKQNEPIIVGAFRGTTDFNPLAAVYNVVASSSYYSGFLLELHQNGTLKEITSLQGGDCIIRDVEIGVNDDYYLSGSYTGIVDFDPGQNQVTPNYSSDEGKFILRLDSSKSLDWLNLDFGGSNSGYNTLRYQNILLDEVNSSVYLAGSTQGDILIPNGKLWPISFNVPSSYFTAGFIVKYDTSGVADWGQVFQCHTRAKISSAFKGIDNSIYLSGHFEDSVAFDFYSKSVYGGSNGDLDGFLLKTKGCSQGVEFMDSVYECSQYYHSATDTLTSDTILVEWFQAANGCDSAQVTYVDIEEPSGTTPFCSINRPGRLSWANYSSNSSYYWYDCDKDSIVEKGKANNPHFYPTYKGNFAVVVFTGPCPDTSACYSMQDVGLEENLSMNLSVYPNPSRDKVCIEGRIDGKWKVVIINSSGKVVMTAESVKELSIAHLPKGVYSITIISDQKKWSEQFVRF